MVFDSATEPNSLVVMTELSHNARTIVVAVHLDKRDQHHVVNKIASVRPREKDSNSEMD